MFAGACAAGRAEEWTRFRGPNGSGVSMATGIPTTWTERDFAWRVRLPGEGHAQPVFWGERVFVTAAQDQGHERLLLCLRQEDGVELWRRTYALPAAPTKNRLSGYANSSPVVDERRVVTCFVSERHLWVRAFTHDGDLLWARDLGPFDSPHGHGASPILHDGRLIVVQDQDDASRVTALAVEDGGILWQAPRRAGGGAAAYGTPVVRGRGAEAELLLTSRPHGISSLDPRSGALNWEAPVLRARTIASPVVAGDLVLGSCGAGLAGPNFLVAVRPGGAGDVSTSHVAYTLRAGVPCIGTPLCQGRRLYLVNDAGIASAVDVATGRVVWSERLGAEFFGSPIWVEGRIYVPSTRGEMFVLAAGDVFRVLARNPLGEATQSSPGVAGGRLYVRTLTHLVSIGGKP